MEVIMQIDKKLAKINDCPRCQRCKGLYLNHDIECNHTNPFKSKPRKRGTIRSEVVKSTLDVKHKSYYIDKIFINAPSLTHCLAR